MKSTQDRIEKALLRLCRAGQFEALLLFNQEGMPMAEAGQCTHYTHDVLTALSIVFHQTIELMNDFQHSTPVDETSMRTANKFRIVSRPVHVADATFILVAIAPQHLAYRKLTNQAVQIIRDLMSS